MRPLVLRCVFAFVVATLCSQRAGAGGGSQADGVAAAPQVRIPMGRRTIAFDVADASAPRSLAWLGNDARNDKLALANTRSAAYELTSDVILKSGDPAAVLARVGISGAVEPLGALRDTWRVRLNTVGGAADAARRLANEPDVAYATVDMISPISLRTLPSDPQFGNEWHLHNTIDSLFDVNAEPAWDSGATGAGVVVGVLDSAIDYNHSDLIGNFNADASSNVASTKSSHGTSVAGIVAAVANNGLFGAGMAYDAQFSRHLLGSNADNAASLNYRLDLNSVFNNSWGPFDNGIAHILPVEIADALAQGVRNGRGGLGTIYVWAGGNGGQGADRMDYDPYVSSRYTISVGAIGNLDRHAAYSEEGSCLMVVTQSDGNGRGIYSLLPNDGQTTSFGGTSAASPLAAGAVALILQANPNLTWRDVRQVLIDTARRNDPNSPTWEANGAGRMVSYVYGYGAIDAGAAVAAARTWTNLPAEISVDTGPVAVNLPLPDNDPTGVTASVDVANVMRIEAVELIVNVTSTYVGDLRIDLTAPSGTNSVFAETRFDSQDDYVDYSFTSFRHLDENTAGVWTVSMADGAAGDFATFNDFRLVFYGTPRCAGDVDTDGAVTLTDLAMLLSSFGACDGDAAYLPAGDSDNNGCVDLGDLQSLLANFDTTCN
ncbi:MAG: hypothetical protein D6744_05305 [Planctomycetota bacterium]|nr:MAG: hypothetical protein D6744_05305 [Planctomycetota bacterium]